MLMWNAHGPGGAARTVLNLTNYLARDRQVEIISVEATRPPAALPLDASVPVTFLRGRVPRRRFGRRSGSASRRS